MLHSRNDVNSFYVSIVDSAIKELVEYTRQNKEKQRTDE